MGAFKIVFRTQNEFKVMWGKVVLWGDMRAGSECIVLSKGLPIGISSLGETDGRKLCLVNFGRECSPD